VVVVAALAAGGCSQLIDPNVPEPIRPMVEPQLGRDYLLYRPSNYDRRSGWPLVVVCHTSIGDSPNKALRDWTILAESRGFLVAAPTLASSAELLPPKVEKELPLLDEDERHILAVVRHVQGGYSISQDRIFIHGWSGGAYPALYVGARHPDVFRAVSLIEPRFDPGYLSPATKRLDPHQPIWVYYSSGGSLARQDARECAAWLREHGGNVYEDPYGPARRTDTDRAVDFYEVVIRTAPWVRIGAYSPSTDKPLEVQFKLRCSFAPQRVHWEFGDGATSNVLEPVHVYGVAGGYDVTVTVDMADAEAERRTTRVFVPVETR
jgi:dienelactone hydrolase